MRELWSHWIWDDFWTPVWPNIAASALLGLAIVRRLNCKQQWCWRIGLHKVEGTTYRTCRHHTTGRHHDALFALHAARYPEQHAHLNRETGD